MNTQQTTGQITAKAFPLSHNSVKLLSTIQNLPSAFPGLATRQDAGDVLIVTWNGKLTELYSRLGWTGNMAFNTFKQIKKRGLVSYKVAHCRVVFTCSKLVLFSEVLD